MITANASDVLQRYLGPDTLALFEVVGTTDLKTLDTGQVLAKRGGRWHTTPVTLSAERVAGFLNAAAAYAGTLFNDQNPDLATQLPAGTTGLARLQAFRPPVSPQPTFILRIKGRSFTLAELAAQGVLTDPQAEALRAALAARRNILVIGGTGSGKTTFLDALLRELILSDPTRHLMVLQDTPELDLEGNVTHLFTSDRPTRNLTDLVRFTLRCAPDNIVVGEIRGAEALPFLDALTTGHPGGLATLHASSPQGACHRLGRLIQRNGVPPDPDLVGAAVDVVAHLEPGSPHPRLVTLARVNYGAGVFTPEAL